MEKYKYIKIKNNKLFRELEKTYSDKNCTVDDLWKALFDDYYIPKENFPMLHGGLDHIEKKRNCFVFHDIGLIKGDGKVYDNTFAICKKKKRKN